eukprot:gene53170-16828_t
MCLVRVNGAPVSAGASEVALHFRPVATADGASADPAWATASRVLDGQRQWPQLPLVEPQKDAVVRDFGFLNFDKQEQGSPPHHVEQENAEVRQPTLWASKPDVCVTLMRDEFR